MHARHDFRRSEGRYVHSPCPASAKFSMVCDAEERTLKKITIHGTDYRATLLELVPAEQLPVFLGGEVDWHPARDEDIGPYVE